MTDITVARYPNDKGKLFRSAEGIIYTALDYKVIALGCDFKNIGVIFPLDTPNLKLLVHKGVPIDDSLARQYKFSGGLLAREIIVTSKSIRLPISQPISLFERVFNYIIKNQESKNFDLKLLPRKIKTAINSRIELDKMWTKLQEIMKQKEESTVLLTKLHYQEMKELHVQHDQEIKELLVRHDQKILNLQSRQDQEKLDNSTDQKENEILDRISELKRTIQP
uniref:Uncharacterized protein n=1 Tax=Pithovirus LCPAC201 TaxID=2506591 RepID=A0A481Z8F5_9VIRU|nr:MAG: hypothetical protein LCPAC201_02720 [Pithovirus LCPAC201]